MSKQAVEETKAIQGELDDGEPQRPDNKVPELAENMEHTLRRLTREKERQRAKNPGLYR